MKTRIQENTVWRYSKGMKVLMAFMLVGLIFISVGTASAQVALPLGISQPGLVNPLIVRPVGLPIASPLVNLFSPIVRPFPLVNPFSPFVRPFPVVNPFLRPNPFINPLINPFIDADDLGLGLGLGIGAGLGVGAVD